MEELRTPSLLVVTSVHPLDDKRVKHKFVDSFLQAGWSVGWVGPSLLSSGRGLPDTRVVYSSYPGPRSRINRISSLRTLRKRMSLFAPPTVIYVPDPDAAVVVQSHPYSRMCTTMLDIHEAYDEVHVANWAPSHLTRPAGAAVRGALRSLAGRFDVVSSVTSELVARFAVRASCPLLLPNCPPLDYASTRAQMSSGGDGSLRVMQGYLSTGRGSRLALEALSGPRLSSVKPRLVGFSDLSPNALLEELAVEASLQGFIEIHPPADYIGAARIAAGCDIGLIDPASYVIPSLPNRLFEFMALALPVLVPRQSTAMNQLVSDTGCGLSYDLSSSEDLGEKIGILAGDPDLRIKLGAAGRAAFLSEYNWDRQFARLLEVL